MLLHGKRGIIFRVANQHSLAWRIAQRCAQHGASLAITYQNERFEEKVTKLAAELPDAFTLQCDLNKDAEIAAVVNTLRERWGTIDFMAHCVAYALREELASRYLDTSREGFTIAMETSVYTFVAAVQHMEPILADRESILTLTYLGSERVVPGYNAMGVAKAALEASVREAVRKITQPPITHTQHTIKPSKPSPSTRTKPTMFHSTNIPHNHTRAPAHEPNEYGHGVAVTLHPHTPPLPVRQRHALHTGTQPTHRCPPQVLRERRSRIPHPCAVHKGTRRFGGRWLGSDAWLGKPTHQRV